MLTATRQLPDKPERDHVQKGRLSGIYGDDRLFDSREALHLTSMFDSVTSL